MSRTTQTRIDDSLIDVFGRVGKSFADKIKKEYGLQELFVPHTVASKILAAKYNGEKFLKFQIKKQGNGKGILKLS